MIWEMPERCLLSTCWPMSEIPLIEIYSFGWSSCPLKQRPRKGPISHCDILSGEMLLLCTCRQSTQDAIMSREGENTTAWGPEAPGERKEQGRDQQQTNVTVLERTSLCQMTVTALQTSSQTALSFWEGKFHVGAFAARFFRGSGDENPRVVSLAWNSLS